MEKMASFWRKDSAIEFDKRYDKTTFFDLPAEVRTHIYELVFDPEKSYADAFEPRIYTGAPQHLHDDYWASDYLKPLLTCRRIYDDAHLLAFSRTTFVVRNPYTALDIAGRMKSRLHQKQITALRSIAVVSEARHFRQMHHWKGSPFGIPSLCLNELTIVLHRSSYWHYLFDFNTIMTTLLRNFPGTKKMKFIRNHALVKPHFHTWFNRFVSLIMTTDRNERFCRISPQPETSWWTWDFDNVAQTATFLTLPPKPALLDVDEYDLSIAPMLDWLKRSIENEEFDSDPMSRNGF